MKVFTKIVAVLMAICMFVCLIGCTKEVDNSFVPAGVYVIDYINETEKWFYPMLQQGKTDYPQYNNQIFVLRYHISSVISSLKHMMHTETCER